MNGYTIHTQWVNILLRVVTCVYLHQSIFCVTVCYTLLRWCTNELCIVDYLVNAYNIYLVRYCPCITLVVQCYHALQLYNVVIRRDMVRCHMYTY